MNEKIIFVLAVGFILGCSCYYIQKCCDLHQQLNPNFDGCIDFDGTKGTERYEVDQNIVDVSGVNFIKLGKKNRHHIWWLPPEVQFLSTNASSGTAFQPITSIAEVQNIRFLYNRKNPCPEFTRILLPFNDYVYLLDNGSLLVTGIADNVRPETMIFPPNVYCLDRLSLTYRRKRRSTQHLLDHSFAIFVCPCLVYSCVRMCCHKRWHLGAEDGFEKCSYTPEIPATLSLNYLDYDGKAMDDSPRFGIVEGIPTCDDYQYLNDNSSTQTKSFWVLPDGSVRVENRSTDVGVGDYCIHFLNIRGHYQLNLRVCQEVFEQNPTVGEVNPKHRTSSMCDRLRRMADFQDLLYKIYFVTGSVFLALTLLVYTFILKRRTSIFDKILCGHVASLFVCYTTMAFDKIARPSPQMWSCKLTGYVVQYTFIASTLWLNVMCLCIYHSFRGYNFASHRGEHLNNSNKYSIYSIYAWGGAAIVSFGTFLVENTAILDSKYRPQFAVYSCWFQNPLAELIYFYLPLTMILASNLSLFIITLKKIFTMQRKSRVLNNQESKKYVGNNEVSTKSNSLSLFIRLFSLTGITWTFEIVSWFIGGPDYYWYIPDALNSLRGVFVFIICCCKKEILTLILKRPTSLSNPANGRINHTSRTSSSDTKSTSLIQMELLKNSTETSAEESA